MQTKFKDGSIMVCGACGRDPEFRTVGQKQSRLCAVGLAVGKRENDETIWANITAWNGLASLLAVARKGDSVAVIGRMKTQERDGKTYTSLVAEWLAVASERAVAGLPQAIPGGAAEEMKAMDDDDGELPF